MASKPQVIYTGRAELAEGPVWHGGALWWIDIVAGTLNRLDPSSGINCSRGTGSYLGAAAPCTDGRWLLARQHDCCLLDWETGRFTPLAAPLEGVTPRHRFNDGKCDVSGRFWVGTAHLDQTPGQSSLFVVEPRGEVRTALRGLSLSNGLGWSPDHRVFYHVDTPTRRVECYLFDPGDAVLRERRTLITLTDSDGWPDGLTVDAEGNLWLGLWGGGAVLRIDGRTGDVLERHPFPASNVSSCTFGGADLRTLFVTTAWEGFSPEQRQKEPLAGAIFALRTATSGLPVVPFPVGASLLR